MYTQWDVNVDLIRGIYSIDYLGGGRGVGEAIEVKQFIHKLFIIEN